MCERVHSLMAVLSCTSALLLLCDHSLAVAQHCWLTALDSRGVSQQEHCRRRLCHSHLPFMRITLGGSQLFIRVTSIGLT